MSRFERPILTVSRSVRDETIRPRSGAPMPELIKGVKIGPKNTKEPHEIEAIKAAHIADGAEIISTAGGNGLNNIKNLEKIHDGPLILRTWIGTDQDGKPDEAGELILADIAKSDRIQPDDIRYVGPTPSGLVIPVGDDRMLFSVHPEGLPSEFASAIPEDPKYAIINSLGGDDWAQSLREGINALTDRSEPVPYAYIPGSLQLDAVREGTQGKREVYNAIRNATVLNVNVDELHALIHGNGFEPSEDPRELLDQGLALGPQHIFATDGAKGAFAATQEGLKVKVSTTKPDRVLGLVGAGDSFAAAAVHRLFEAGSIVEAGRWGSAASSYNVEHVGAHDFAPTREQITRRLKDPDRRPTVVNLTRRFDHKPKIVDLFRAS